MERLTEWGEFQANVVVHEDETMSAAVFEIVQKLAHYEDLEEQGRLIVLPCRCDGCTHADYVKNDRVYCMEHGCYVDIDDFCSKAEAEQALADMQKG